MGVYMKNFVLNCGRKLIDVSAWIIVIAIVCGGLCTGAYALIIIPVGILMFVIFYYLLYVLIDIRDNLKDIKNKIGN